MDTEVSKTKRVLSIMKNSLVRNDILSSDGQLGIVSVECQVDIYFKNAKLISILKNQVQETFYNALILGKTHCTRL